jgi:hypothetical protein
VADIFEEVDEEVRRDRFADLWKRYGVYFLAACVAVVVATAGWVGYREWRESKRLEYAERYRAAAELAQKDQLAEAADAFAALAEEASGGYAVLARLRLAASQAEAGDRDAAVATYDRLAADGGVEKVYRDLATLAAAMLLADVAPGAEIDRRLEPLLNPDNPWRHSAREVKGLTALREGRAEAARESFQAIVDDAAAPGAVRGRAQQMLQAIDKA